MGEDGVALLRNGQPAQLFRHIVETSDLDPGDVIEIAGTVGIVARAIGYGTLLPRDRPEIGYQTLPER